MAAASAVVAPGGGGGGGAAAAGPSLLSGERSRASVDADGVLALTRWLDGDASGAVTSARRKLVQAVAEDPGFACVPRQLHVMGREDRFAACVGLIVRLDEVRASLGVGREDREARSALRRALPVSLPTDLHDGVCVGFLQAQFTEEQQARLVPPALRYEHLYAYAQTELGHGSNVQGLETTATFVKGAGPDGDGEFEIHSPELTSIKWWPGCLGRLATHVICMAQLIIDGKRIGITPFVVPIRDPGASHAPLPGIEAGDIGATGYELVDNGYVRFNKVRIPRDNMAMRFAKVTREGEYVPAKNPRLMFGGMVAVRAMIVGDAAGALGTAVTIATRYSAQRRQFAPAGDGKGEQPVLDYTMQQFRLFPLLAAAYGLRFAGASMRAMHEDLQRRLDSLDMSTLAEVHATSSGLKSMLTQISGDGIEVARRACGGHGFSRASGFWTLYENYVGVQTAEGENYLLTQQTARYLLKTAQKLTDASAPPPSGTVAYMADAAALLEQDHAPQRTAKQLQDDLAWHSLALRRRACRLVSRTALQLQRLMTEEEELPAHEAWNRCQVEFSRMSRAHCLVFVVDAFHAAIEDALRPESGLGGSEGATVVALRRLASLFALYHMEAELSDFTEDGWLDAAGADAVRAAVRGLCGALRRDAVPLVDALDIHDFQLRSAIGNYDGAPYETLYSWAQHDSANSHEGREHTARVAGTLKTLHARL